MLKRLALALAILCLTVSGCSSGQSTTPAPGSQASPAPTASPGPTPTPTSPPPTSLVIWVPPALAPDPSVPAGALFADRIQAFERAHPGIKVDVRVKDPTGPAGLLETLSAAQVAAPQVLPDLVALDPVSLNTAVLKHLVFPLGETTSEAFSSDWYEYAKTTAQSEGRLFSLPFAADALGFAFRTDRFDPAPTSWATLINAAHLFVFPANDPQAVFTLAEYQSLHQEMSQPTGRPGLDTSALASVLDFYASADRTGYLPPSAAQMTTLDDSWAALNSRRVDAAAARLSTFMGSSNRSNLTFMPLPTQGGKGISYAYTWSWAIASETPARQDLAKLAIAFFTEPSFVGPWTEALGLMPSTSSALQSWSSVGDQAIVGRLAAVAQPAPGAEVLGTFGPPLHSAVQDVLAGNVTAGEAASQAAQAIQNP
jgi:ABC-type glycerol-3-phosphate transport system substrate-binding protein